MKEFKKGKEFFRYVNRWWLLGWFFTALVAGFLFVVFFVPTGNHPDTITIIMLLGVLIIADGVGKWITRKILTTHHFPAYSRVEMEHPLNPNKKINHIYAIAYDPYNVELVIPQSLMRRKDSPEDKIKEDIEKYVRGEDYDACHRVIYL